MLYFPDKPVGLLKSRDVRRLRKWGRNLSQPWMELESPRKLVNMHTDFKYLKTVQILPPCPYPGLDCRPWV